jgi:hypothetical protein
MLSLVLALALVVLPSQETKTVGLLDMGYFTYDTAVSGAPDVPGLQGGGCHVEPRQLNLRVFILRYAGFEEFILAGIESSDPELAQAIRGEEALIDGHTRHSITGPRLYFYQMPNDYLFVHEVMHVIYPYDDEVTIRARQHHFLASHEYKNWLKRNY